MKAHRWEYPLSGNTGNDRGKVDFKEVSEGEDLAEVNKDSANNKSPRNKEKITTRSWELSETLLMQRSRKSSRNLLFSTIQTRTRMILRQPR
jgi:hypothetical protein